MGLPVGRGDLVADHGIAGGRVRDAQQRLGQAHERDALLAGERIFLDQTRHAPAAVEFFPAQRHHQLAGQRPRGLGLVRLQARIGQERWQALGLRSPARIGDSGAQRALGLHALGKFLKGTGRPDRVLGRHRS